MADRKKIAIVFEEQDNHEFIIYVDSYGADIDKLAETEPHERTPIEFWACFFYQFICNQLVWIFKKSIDLPGQNDKNYKSKSH